ncbi:hypothetical protein R3X28_18980, partial [Maribacter sp. TH_r10]|nr:hypothetical protein [Maribacter sp. TH_r10]
MKRTLFFLVLGLLLGTGAKGQIKIGDNPQTIDPSSVLELESGSRVLVVTRVSTAEMNAITPLPGAVVYNTDLQCVHYYNGTEWINICEEVGGIPNLTTEPFVNTRSTIVITTDGENNHIEVAQNSIRTEQIVDGGINGVDIQNNSIGNDKLGNDAVGREEIIDNAVGIDALDTSQVTLESFTNTPGFITSTDIISGDTGNDIMIGIDEGAFYDEQPVLDAIQVNTDAIAVNAGEISTNSSEIDTNTASILSNALNIGLNADNIQINTDNILLKEDAANKSDDVALGNSADLFPTQNAVKTYVDNATGAVSTLNNGEIYVGNASNVATSVAMSGDATIDNTGVITIENDAITTAKILNGQVTNAKIAANTINSNRILNGTIQEIDIADAAVTPIKIEPSPTNGRYLSTNASGVVEWVDLPAATVNTDNQQLTLASDVLTLEDGGTPISLASYLDNTDEQQLSISGNRISLTDGGFVDLPPGTVDTDEQQLTLEPGNLLTLEDGGTPINLTPFLNTDEQTISDFTFDDTTNILTLTIDNGGTETANLSSLAGGTPTAADVTFSATGNTTSGNVQAAIEELQTEIDGISSGGTANPSDELITSFALNGTGLDIAEGTNILPTIDLDLTFATDAALATAIGTKEDAANKSTDVNLADATNTLFPTETAVKTYVDTQIGSIATPTIVSGDTGNSISASGTDGGAFYDDSTIS